MKQKRFFYSITRNHMIHALKAAVAALCAVFIAEFIGLDYPGSCAVIALITVAGTKKETFLLSFRRLLTFVISIFVSFGLYHIIGIHYLFFGLFVFIMALISYGLGMYSTISVNAVVATHILSQGNLTQGFIFNEILLVVIGTSIAIIVNLYMPNDTKKIKVSINQIETMEKEVLRHFALWLREGTKENIIRKQLNELESFMQDARIRAMNNKDNILATHAAYYVQYMDMRIQQCGLLVQIADSLSQLTYMPEQSEILAKLFEHTVEIFHERNNGSILLMETAAIENSLKIEELPATREEFENRAILYHTLLQLKRFLDLKKKFADALTDEQVAVYWKRNN